MYQSTKFIFIFLVFTAHGTNHIDNGLTEDPSIKCGSESLSIFFKTLSAFEGHVYVKGHYSKKGCRSDATLERQVNISITYSACDVNRQRSSSPKGIMMTATIIISFHPMFITKIDRSYKVQCFYAEASKTVTQQLDVKIANNQERNIFVMVGDDVSNSSRQTADSTKRMNDPSADQTIDRNVPLPDCQYKVLNEDKSEEVMFATVGQLVYHQWSCEHIDKKYSSPFCVTVHSCNVKDETGKEVQIFDENGCAVDKYLINNLEYSNDLTGGQLSQVFKFADQPSVFFQCKIRLSLKNENGICKRTSDECPMTLRGKRSTENDDFDVISQTMTILDIDEPTKAQRESSDFQIASKFYYAEVCVTSSTASVIVLIMFSLFLILFVMSLILCFRHQTVKVKLAP